MFFIYHHRKRRTVGKKSFMGTYSKTYCSVLNDSDDHNKKSAAAEESNEEATMDVSNDL